MSTAKLILNGQEHEFEVIEGTEKELGIDTGTLRAKTKAITLDPGYGNTGSCESAVTFINGEKGILRYRGYPIEQLAEGASFSEVANLLIYGELPDKNALASWDDDIAANGALPDAMKRIIEQYPKTAHPMAVLGALVDSIAAFHDDYSDNDKLDLHYRRLMGQAATIAAAHHNHVNGKSTDVAPAKGASYAGNFLKMMFGGDITPEVEEALDMLLIVHADHEQNCSTSTVRMTGSSHANIYACMAAGISALWGPLHGGANQAVIEMLDRIKADGGDPKKYMEMAKDKDSGFRLMGFGHRVYKNFDPRATILKKSCDKVLKALGVNDPVLDIAKNLEQIALEDDFFIERKLYPNVDFYSGIIYRAMGIPVNMFTVMFAIGRMPGWIAHWKEQNEEGGRIHRPRQIYIGATERNYPKA